MSELRLLIDSSSMSGSLCLAKVGDVNSTIIALKFTEDVGTHGNWLLKSIDEILRANNISTTNITSYAITDGPGSFTGLRIGVNTLKGLAFSQPNMPVFTISSLKSIALNFEGSGLVCPILDARKNELYSAIYKVKDGKIVETIIEDHIVNSQDLLSNLSKYKEKIHFVGAGVTLVKDELLRVKNNLDYEILSQDANLVRAEKMLHLTLLSDCPKTTPSELKPAYIRRAEDVFKKQSPKQRNTK